MLGMAQSGEGEQRTDSGQPGVSGGGAYLTIVLQVGQERGDGRGVEVFEVQLCWLFVTGVRDVAQQEPPRVAVGGDRVRAGLALADQPVGEERLQGRGERGHGRFPGLASSRSLASLSSSGDAVRYQ